MQLGNTNFIKKIWLRLLFLGTVVNKPLMALKKADSLLKIPFEAGEGWVVQNTDIEPKSIRFPFLEFLI